MKYESLRAKLINSNSRATSLLQALESRCSFAGSAPQEFPRHPNFPTAVILKSAMSSFRSQYITIINHQDSYAVSANQLLLPTVTPWPWQSEGATLVFVRAVGHVLSPWHGPHGAEIFVQARDLQHVDHCLAGRSYLCYLCEDSATGKIFR